jgi:hypothetical protein
MPELVFAKGIASKLEQIIDEARSIVLMISPYVQLDDRIVKKLKFANERGVLIVLMHLPRKLSDGDKSFFNGLKNSMLIPIKDLHAKCYLNEQDSVLIGSMNLYKYSENTNWEMGVFFDFQNEEEFGIYEKMIEEIGAMIFSNVTEVEFKRISEAFERFLPIQYFNGYVEVEGQKYTNEEFKLIHQSLNVNTGYCIKCGKKINFFPLKPYCLKCYRAWQDKDYPDKPEKYCHRCKIETETSLNDPQCEICSEYYFHELGLYFRKFKK